MRNSPQNFYKKFLGEKGERLAEKFLKKQGYSVLERNYKTYYGEADLIVSKDGVIIFVEVKTRTNTEFGAPSDAVDIHKQNRYRRICEYFFYERKFDNVEVRFDVIEVYNGEINHIIDAF